LHVDLSTSSTALPKLARGYKSSLSDTTLRYSAILILFFSLDRRPVVSQFFLVIRNWRQILQTSRKRMNVEHFSIMLKLLQPYICVFCKKKSTDKLSFSTNYTVSTKAKFVLLLL